MPSPNESNGYIVVNKIEMKKVAKSLEEKRVNFTNYSNKQLLELVELWCCADGISTRV
jgi:hypothetical protein